MTSSSAQLLANQVHRLHMSFESIATTRIGGKTSDTTIGAVAVSHLSSLYRANLMLPFRLAWLDDDEVCTHLSLHMIDEQHANVFAPD